MNIVRYRARWAFAASMVTVAALLLGGCNVNDTLLEPQQPGVIGPESVDNAIGAEALRIGALQQLSAVTGGATTMWSSGGTLADEWKSSDTFFQTDETDRRTIPTNNSQVSNQYRDAQIARGHAKTAIEALKKHSPERAAYIAQRNLPWASSDPIFTNHSSTGLRSAFTKRAVPTYLPPLPT